MAQIERLMAEVTPGSRPEATPPVGPVGEVQTGPIENESQPPVQSSGEQHPQKPWHISPEYDSKKAKEYAVKEEGNYNVFTDPATDKEVARVLRIAGGSLETATLQNDEVSERLGRLRNVDIWSNEFQEIGISITKDLIDLESEVYQAKYSDGGRQLDIFYKEWKAWVAKKGKQSVERKPPPKETELEEQISPQERAQPDNLDDIEKFESVRDAYIRLRVTRHRTPEQQAELNDAETKLSRCFKEARRMGFLYGIDESLKEVYQDIMQGTEAGYGQRRRLSPAETMARVENAKGYISLLGQRTFQTLLMRFNTEDIDLDKIEKLVGVWDFYAELATGRFALLLNGGGLIQPPTIDGEFTFNLEDLDPKDAEEFRKLSERREVYWHPTYANYFEVSAKTPEQFQIAVDTFTQWLRLGLTKSPNEIFQRVNGFKDALTTAGVRERANVSTSLMAGLRRELEGLVGILGANFQNEHYNNDYYKQFLTFVAQDEGPDRFIRLSRANRGRSAAVLWKFDKDPRFELLFSPHGSRGQLMEERNTVRQRELIEQILAMLTAEIVGVGIKEYYPQDSQRRSSVEAVDKNLDDIARFQSDESFKNLFEGFDQKAQDDLYKQLERKQRAIVIQEAIKDGMDTRHLSDEERRIYEEFTGKELKKIELTTAEVQAFERLVQVRRIQDYLRRGGDPDDLTGRDADVYQTARNAVDLAYEMYGAMGEKAKRSGAAFLVDRKDAEGRKFVDYVPAHWAEKFVHFTENWTKAEYGHLPAALVKDKVAQARKMAVWALKRDGFDAKLFNFTLTIDGKIVDLETFLGLDKYHQPLHPNILGYDRAGNPVILTFDQDGKPIGLEGLERNRDNRYIFYDQPPRDGGKGFVFDNLDINTRANRMLLKTPKGTIDPTTGRMKVERTEPEPVDFDKATHHIYARWTGHPYWGYQEEDTGLLLTEESYEDARKIKAGLLRPEDAIPHAVQLLIVDPTLERVAHFDHHEGREDKIALAAVEDSYQSHWRITDQLYQAFYPADADDEYNRVAYILQDQGGSTKQWFHARAEAARWPDMKMRRGRTMIPILPLHFSSMSEMWGAPGGALDILRMMNYKQYRMVGQFALEKWINQTGGVQDVYEALYGFVNPQEKRSREGLGEKPNNDADKLEKFYRQVMSIFTKNRLYDDNADAEDVDNEFMNAVRTSLERFDFLFQRIRVLETDMRGERTPLWLEGIDIFERSPDGSIKKGVDDQKVFNRNIDKMRDTGSARHSGNIFFWRFVRWLRSDKPEEGQDLYSSVAKYYELFDHDTYESLRAVKDKQPFAKLQSRWEWLCGKINR